MIASIILALIWIAIAVFFFSFGFCLAVYSINRLVKAKGESLKEIINREVSK